MKVIIIATIPGILCFALFAPSTAAGGNPPATIPYEDATLSEAPPVIVTPPADRTILRGESATFHVEAAGEPNPDSYQWQFNNRDIPGATGNILTVENADLPDSGEYRVIVGNSQGTVTSPRAFLHVRLPAPPVILASPQPRHAYPREEVTFTIEVLAIPDPEYQWLHNGEPISGATGPSLTLPRATPADTGDYTVFVSNAYGDAKSDPARLELHPPSAIQTVFVGNPGNSPDTRLSIDDTAHGAVDYQYRIGKHEITNDQYAAFLNSVAKTDSFGLFNPHESTAPLEGILREGVPGEYTYTVKPDMEHKPVTPVSLSDALRFVNWLHNGRPSGFQDESTTEAGAYMLSSGRPVRLEGARWFLPSEEEWYKAAYYDPSEGDSGGYRLFPTQHDEPPAAEPPPGGNNSANYGYGEEETPGANGSVTEVDAYQNSKSFYGTRGQAGNVWEWTEPLSPSTFILRGGSWRSPAHVLHSWFRRLEEEWDRIPRSGFRVGQKAAPSSAERPRIHLQPWSQQVLSGGAATFLVQAVGAPEPDFQWRRNGVDIPGATGPVLAIEDVNEGDAGTYKVVVSNEAGTVISQAESLEVLPLDSPRAIWAADSGGSWGEPLNWEEGRPPARGDSVLIDPRSAAYEVTYRGDHEIKSLFSNTGFTMSEGTLSVDENVRINGPFFLQAGTLEKATVQRGGKGGDNIRFTRGLHGRLHGVTMKADMDLTRLPSGPVPARATISGGLVMEGSARIDHRGILIFDETQEITGSGEFAIGPHGGRLLIVPGSQVTLGPDLTVRGGTAAHLPAQGHIFSQSGPGEANLVNQGRIRADIEDGWLKIGTHGFVNRGVAEAVNGSTLVLASPSWTNRGVIRATDSTLILGDGDNALSHWRNEGTIQALQSRIELEGNFSTSDLGDLSLTESAVVVGGRLDNRDAELALHPERGQWQVRGGTIRGGTVSGEAGGLTLSIPQEGPTAVFDGVTLEAPLDASAEGAILQIRNGLTINAAATFGDSSTVDLLDGEFRIGRKGILNGLRNLDTSLLNEGAVSIPADREMRITGNFRQSPSGTLQATWSNGEDHGLHAVSGADLNGSLSVSLPEDFVPEIGNQFRILTGQYQGRFASVNLPRPRDGVAFQLRYEENAIVAGAVPSPEIEVLSSPTLSNQTGLYEQNVRIRNDGNVILSTPRITFADLPEGVEVFNATGYDGDQPYIEYGQPLRPGRSADLQIRYFAIKRGDLPDPLLIAGNAVSIITPVPGRNLVTIRRAYHLEPENNNGETDPNEEENEEEEQEENAGDDGDENGNGNGNGNGEEEPESGFAIEFDTFAHRMYHIQYSHGLQTWRTVPTPVIGNGGLVRWIDESPPATHDSDSGTARRTYRILLLP